MYKQIQCRPNDQEIVGSNPAYCWAFFPYYTLSDVPLSSALFDVKKYFAIQFVAQTSKTL